MYQVKLTLMATTVLNHLHPEIKSLLKNSLKKLYDNPYLGKALRNELAGLRSLKIKRYRVVYKIDEAEKAAVVYAIGHRRNIYEIVGHFTDKMG